MEYHSHIRNRFLLADFALLERRMLGMRGLIIEDRMGRIMDDVFDTPADPAKLIPNHVLMNQPPVSPRRRQGRR